MRFKCFHLFQGCDDASFTCNAEIHVPGLGDITIENCISTETFEEIKNQVVEVLRIRLGIAKPSLDDSIRTMEAKSDQPMA